MTQLKLPITPLLQTRIDRVLRAAELYPNPDDGYGPLEQEQLALAEVVMAVYHQQRHRLDRLPRRPKAALMLAGQHNPDLLAEYVRIEKKIGHRFRVDLSLAEVQQALQDGEQPGEIRTWRM